MGTTQTHPTPTTQIYINLIDLDCSEEAQCLCVFGKLLHLMNPNLDLNRGDRGGVGLCGPS